MAAIALDPDTPPEVHLDVLRRTLGPCLVAVQDLAEGSDQPATVARCLAALRDMKADTATVYADVEAHLLACMGDRRLEVPGLGLVESHRRTKRTGWDHDALVADVLAIVDARTGEDTAPADVARALRETISFGAGKIGGLKAFGLVADEYCQETPDGWSVQLPPRDHGSDVA